MRTFRSRPDPVAGCEVGVPPKRPFVNRPSNPANCGKRGIAERPQSAMLRGFECINHLGTETWRIT